MRHVTSGRVSASSNTLVPFTSPATRRSTTRVVERRVGGEANGSNALELALTLPLVTWRMLTTLSGDERVAWIVWTWAVFVLARLAAYRRGRRATLV